MPPAKSQRTLSDLRRVLAVNSQINSTLNIDELLGIIMTTAGEVMRAEASSLMLVDESTQDLVFKVALGEKGEELKEKFRVKMGEGVAGWVAQKGESVIVNDTGKDPRFARRFDKGTGFTTRAIACVPLKAKGKIIGVLQALNPLGRVRFSAADLELFETFADQAAISIENARLHRELVKQEIARQELKIAREIQQHFLPVLAGLSPAIAVAAENIPAHEVSGDFYDVFRLEGDKTGILIGDVSGKGIPAALYMVRAISDSRFLAPRSRHPSELLRELNARLVKDASFGFFTTLLYVIVNPQENTIEYASAGHHPPLLRLGSPARKVQDLSGPAGIPLGIFENSEYPDSQVSFGRGDTFFLYTDGIIEARDKHGAEFELQRLTDLIAVEEEDVQKDCFHLFEQLRDFTRDAEQHDDMTLVAVKHL